MQILIAQNAGFCQGVRRAIDKTLTAAKEKSLPVYTLGPVVHNPAVVDQLSAYGVGIVNDLEALENTQTRNPGYLVIRSHGAGPEVFSCAQARGWQIIDTTCPFVKKVQEKASKLHKNGYQVFIVGTPNHPEVKAIKEWTDNQAIVIETREEALNLPDTMNGSAVVAQTTIRKETFEQVVEILTEKDPTLKVYNTICDATKKRQEATREVAKKVDVMVVIGGYNSSNTKKLKELAVNQNVPTYHIENAAEINGQWFLNCKKIGVTAGASTPDWIIKEVVEKMKEFENERNENEMEKKEGENQELENNESPEEKTEIEEEKAEVEVEEEKTEVEEEKDLGELMDENETSFDLQLKRGQTVQGTVVKIEDDSLLVDVGYKFEGTVPLNELFLNADQKPADILNEGDEISVKVVQVDDEEGILTLSKKWADKEKVWEKLETAHENDDELEAQVLEEVKGGLLVDLNHLHGFVPASHVDLHYVPDLSEYIGSNLRVKPIELDRSKNKVVLSQKNILQAEQEEKKQETLNTIKEGDIVDGKVKRLTNFGAFIDVGGIDGLCHISEISHSRIDHPESVLSNGETVQVKVIKLDPDNEKISLSLKEAQPDPFEKFMETYQVGDIVKGKVVRTVDFGAFVEIIPGVEGLCHISQLSDEHVAKTEDIVNTGDEIDVKILNIDPEQKKVGLSVKEAKVSNSNSKSEKSQSTSNAEVEEIQSDDDDNVKLGDMFGDLLGGIKDDEDSES